LINFSCVEGIIIKDLEKKSVFLDFFSFKSGRTVTIEEIELVYLPFWVAFIDNEIPLTKGHFGMIVVLDGVGGEVGVAFGDYGMIASLPCSSCVVINQFTKEEAQKRIHDYAQLHYSRKKKLIPVTTIVKLENVYMPHYVVRARVQSPKKDFRVIRFIDAETGMLIYRYDGRKEHLKQYPELAKIIELNSMPQAEKGE
jgi:hypothetical protein